MQGFQRLGRHSKFFLVGYLRKLSTRPAYSVTELVKMFTRDLYTASFFVLDPLYTFVRLGSEPNRVLIAQETLRESDRSVI